MDFRVVQRCDRENGGKGVVGGVGFEDDLHVWNLMSQYQSSGKGFLRVSKDSLHSGVKFQTIPFLVRCMSGFVISE